MSKAKMVVGGLVTVFFMFLSQTALPAMSQEELLKRLNDLSEVIQKQQQEIERLRQELKKQGKTIDEVKGTQQEKIQQAVKSEWEEKEKGWRDSIPKWINQIKVSGDLRLRYEGLYGREQRQANLTTRDIPNNDQYRIRARLFFDGKISDEVSAHLMLCTNQDANREATTTNQSFTDDFNDKSIYIHRAYGTYKPKWFQGLEITGGKFRNTFLHTTIMWDPDVNPEGIYERYQYSGWKDFRPFIQLGQTVLNNVDTETDDPALYINQVGFEWKIDKVKWTLAGSYYDWANLHNTRYLHLAQYRRGGGNTFARDNTGTLQYLYDYNLWEAISFIDFDLGPIPTTLIFDYIVNYANNVPNSQDTAYYLGFKLGKEMKKGDYSFWYKYARIEKDAVIGSMNDQDFYGANRKGHRIRVVYMLLDRLSLETAFFYTDPITAWMPTSVNWANEQNWEHENRLQMDFIFRF